MTDADQRGIPQRGSAQPGIAQRWIEVTAQVDPRDVDLVADVLGDVAPEGVAIEPAIEPSDTEDFVFTELEAPSLVRASFPAPFGDAARRALRRRLTALPLHAPLGRLRYREVEPADWAEEWKRFYEVMHIGRRLVVRPSWEPYEPRPGEAVIELDPGTAFGTGQHQTTRLCLEAIERHLRPGAEVLDVGAGSGILGIAAAKLGAASVRAVDVDASTVPIARENAARNGVGGKVVAAAGSLGEGWPWPRPSGRSADLLIANISSTVLVALMPEFARAVRPGGLAILSGFIDRSESEVCAAAEAAGLAPMRLDADGDWRCLVATYAPGAAAR